MDPVEWTLKKVPSIGSIFVYLYRKRGVCSILNDSPYKKPNLHLVHYVQKGAAKCQS